MSLGKDGSLQIPRGGMNSKRAFEGSIDLHVEFLVPLMPSAHSQGRGNSGVFLPNSDEIQVLDSFGDATYLGGGCGGIYAYKDPDAMEVIESLKSKPECRFSLASLPPLTWQTVDVEYRVETKDGKPLGKPRVTVCHNGVKIHDNVELRGPVVGYVPKGKLHFQDHGDPVRYRNTWVLPVAFGAAQPKTKPQPPAAKPALPAGVQAQRDLEYVPGGHARNKLDLFLPAKADHPLPVIVWIHGGGWQGGSKEGCPALPFVGKGFAVASINYRLSQHAIFPAQIEDCKAAIRWLRASAKKYGLDGNHIGVWGASAGGHLVALLGTSGDVKELQGKGENLDRSSRVQCVVDWFGPTDFTRMGGWQDKPDSPMAKLVGGPVRDRQELAGKANPITYVTKDDPPFLIMHGEEDKVVPMNQSELLDEAVRKVGVESTLVRIPGNGHGGPGFTTPENWRKIEDFFEKHLK